jgi:arylesterase/paraoxonase
MPPLLRRAIIAVVVIVAVAGLFTWRFLSAAGYFTGIRAELPADCHDLASVPGPEDIQIDRARGQAFVSALDWRAALRGEKGVRGGIYVIDLKAPQADWALHPVTANEPADFKPHGLSLYVGPDGKRRLFVVNHAAAGDAVEIFDVAEDGMLTHVKTVTDPLLVSPNDVVGVGPESFYVTNDHTSRPGLMRTLGDVMLLRNANVVYYDGKAMSIATDHLLFANGINVSPDGKTLYVAESLGAALDVYTRDPATGILTGRDYTKLGTGLDNIDVQPDGALLIAAHPNLIAFMKHAADPKALSPSQVVRVEPGANGGGKAGTIYLNFGEQVSGSSVAAGYGDLMLIGNVFSPKILVCKQSKELKAF